MRRCIQAIAGLTVVAAMLIAPLLSRGLARVEAPGFPPGPGPRVVPLPDGWEGRIFAHIRARRPNVEPDELRAVISHVDRTAARLGVDALTVLGVIEVESGFNPYAISPAGAMGLMQLRSDTAREIAGRLGIGWESDEALFDPELNVLLGTTYLRELLDQFGDLDLALAAFVAGPNRIASRPVRPGSVPLAYADRVWGQVVALQNRVRTGRAARIS